MAEEDKSCSMPTVALPAVSIGMPVYDGEKYIRRALDSLLAQTFTDFELIISDNASTDGTGDICREYAARDNRIKYICHKQNLGAAVNYNYLLDVANAKYFFFAPHDDEWLEDWIDGAVNALEASPEASIALGTIDFVGRDNEIVGIASPPWRLDQTIPSERIRRYLNTEVTDHLLYGVIRFNSIRNFRLGLGETSPEKALIFTILANGSVIDSKVMKMINHMSHKTKKELYIFFNFKRWYWANFKSHISVIKALFRELPFRVTVETIAMYFTEIIERKIFGKKKNPGNVQLFRGGY